MLVFNYQKCRAKAALHTHTRICKVRAKINKEKSKTKIKNKKEKKKTHFFSQFKSVKPIKKRQSKNLETTQPGQQQSGSVRHYQRSIRVLSTLAAAAFAASFFFGFLFFIFLQHF